MRLSLALVLGSLAASLAACKGKSEPGGAQPPPAAVTTPADAGPGGITTIPGDDPSSGMHLDDDVDDGDVGSSERHTERPRRRREGTPIDVTLRSTPPGAMAAVDGTPLGPTPTYWAGVADGREHEFTFDLRGHALARYRFVPITSGVIHARLERITDEPDAGVPPPEVVPNRPAAPVVVPPPSPVKPVPDAMGAAPGTPVPADAPASTPGLGAPAAVPGSGASGPGLGPQP